MLTRLSVLSRSSLAGIAFGACMVAPIALAANTTGSADMEARYQRDVERCNTGQTNQDKATCLQEAGAALEEARRQRLATPNANTDENAVKRCEALPASQRDDCMLQMSGHNTKVLGSVEGGGVLRETTITIPGETTYAPASSPALAPGLVPTPVTPATSAPSLAPSALPITPVQ